jgi:hypothetical protein
MNEYRICWFSRLGFQGKKQGKNLCSNIVCICHCIFYIYILLQCENLRMGVWFAVNIVQG